MKFSKKEIKMFNKKNIQIDERKYATEEIFYLLNFVDFNSALQKNMWFEVFGPSTSIRWATEEQRKCWPQNINKEDITECPKCKNKLEIKRDKTYVYYKCEDTVCNYISYIINKEFNKYLLTIKK